MTNHLSRGPLNQRSDCLELRRRDQFMPRVHAAEPFETSTDVTSLMTFSRMRRSGVFGAGF